MHIDGDFLCECTHDFLCDLVTVTVHAVPIHAGYVTVHAIALDMLLETALRPFTAGYPAVSDALKEELLLGELCDLILHQQLHLQ